MGLSPLAYTVRRRLGLEPGLPRPLCHVCPMLILRILIDICGEDGLVSAVMLNAPSCNLGPEREGPLGPAAASSKPLDRSMQASDVARRIAQLVLDVRLAVASSC